MDREEFQEDHTINPHALDVECLRQPTLFFKWAERAIKARGLMDKAKFEMELVESRLQLQVRANPGDFNLDKATEGSIKAAAKDHKKYKKAVKKHQAAREESALLDKAVMAMEMKKRMLETLITLHGQQYFSGPSTPRDLGEAYILQQAEADKNLAEREKGRTRKPRKEKE